jgi:hypothetical protein
MGINTRIELSSDTIRHLNKALEVVPDKVVRKVIARASKRAMKSSLKLARALAPRRSGFFRKALSLVQKRYRASGTFYTVIGPRVDAFDPVTGERPHKIAHLIEKGTRPHKITLPSGRVVNHPGAAPTHMLLKTHEQKKGEVQDTFEAEIIAGVDREVERVANRSIR